jgi:hypothetical protein
MKIDCHCGAIIIDQTDYLPHKGHLIPDQEWFAIYDAIDEKVIAPLVGGRLDKETAYRRACFFISNSARLMYQCRECGRLYIDDGQAKLQCYLPADGGTAREILRSRESNS